jgi:glycosyltransferase involved in cell wall biosynthesis
MKLSIVIPAYNEEKRLKAMMDAYAACFPPRYGDQMEFIVVVNGSTDGTEDVARSCAAACPQIRVIVEPGKIGKGGAVMRGFAAAQGERVGFVDADGSTPPEAFQDLVDHIGNAGIIIASRWIEGAVVSPKQPPSRLMAGRVFNGLIRFLFKLKINDTQCGAKLLTREAVQAVLPHLGLTRWAFDVDLLFQIRRHGFAIVEWPTTWHDTAGSKLRVFRVSIEMFMAICRLRILYSPFRWIVAVYDRTLGRLIHLRAEG